MCGIALVIGPGGQPSDLDPMMAAIAGRGELDERRHTPTVQAGTQRLRIVDREHAVQPWQSPDGRWLLCYNGEVFNHDELRAELAAAGHTFGTESDTEVVMTAFLEWGEAAVDRLRGEFAFAVVDLHTDDTYLVRDPLGVKPLYFSWRHGRLHVASEIKALVGVGAAITEVPPGHHGWARRGSGPHLLPHYDIRSTVPVEEQVTDPREAVDLVRRTLSESIAIRLRTDLTVGVVLSGGLDSSVVLHHVHRMHPDCVAVTIGAPGSKDLEHARRLTAELGVRHEVVDLRPADLGWRQMAQAVRVGELTEYGDIINAAVSIPLFRRFHDLGIKVVLTGDGSDELFGGYRMYHDIDAAQGERLFVHKLANLGRTELHRVDRAAMSQGVEARVPFLDREMVTLARRIPLAMKIGGPQEKWLVREAFADILPDHIRTRPKSGMSYSSGLHDRARLFKPLFPTLHRRNGFDLHAPVRRDFDTVLHHQGDDLDLATVELARRGDNTPLERGKDLLGAVRWNVEPPVRRWLAGRR
ncbi:asparagine synthetase B [Nakamurella flava]|uniref:asparagine synthase (glutamine-hydrolyzing) n=1 Tax=Nakamurella flava TaxID=2576308 RepID=A0A4U6QKW7_9ACTN|nr:asparagine synthase-related protein [Nakamurella flava]TKV60929.1 asparagine synthetase B [Nakamurella flava]